MKNLIKGVNEMKDKDVRGELETKFKQVKNKFITLEKHIDTKLYY